MASILVLAIHMLLAQPPDHEDCLQYNSQSLRVEHERSGLWLLTDGGGRMLQFASEEDAKNGLALAQRYSQYCFIGRHPSTRPNAPRAGRRLIVHYWKEPTGQQTRISAETCQTYAGSALRGEDRGAAGWLVTDGKTFRIPVDDSADANAVIALARQYSTHCTIGSADPPSPLSRVDYWK